jgi:hypothetical protein
MRNAVLALALGMTACGGSEPTEINEEPMEETATPTYGSDLEFLGEHQDVIELSDLSGSARVAVVAEYQGRVMTSTSGGSTGPSYGWLNREAIAAKERKPHINVFGGEDRFWLGPEGGQYSIFFAQGDPFDLEHWQTPEPIDWGPWEVADRSASEVRFRKAIELVNYAGTKLSLEVSRVLRIVDPGASETEAVGYESESTITNTGENAWTKETGLLSIWILGMFNPSPATTVVIPFVAGPEEELGPIVNDAYFGKIPADRLVVGDGVLYFRGDGEYRGKIGVQRKRALPVMGSYDAEGNVLTLVEYTLPADATDYVNSMWEISDSPYQGDAVNSYNDGPPAPGAPPLGPFYELESSSPAAEPPERASLRPSHAPLPRSRSRARCGGRKPRVSIADIVSAFERDRKYRSRSRGSGSEGAWRTLESVGKRRARPFRRPMAPASVISTPLLSTGTEAASCGWGLSCASGLATSSCCPRRSDGFSFPLPKTPSRTINTKTSFR